MPDQAYADFSAASALGGTEFWAGIQSGSDKQITPALIRDYIVGHTGNLTAGYTATGFSAGTKSSGTFTPDPASGGFQYYTNGGAHTLAPPSTGSGDSTSIIIDITNNGSAGAITTSGFTKVNGDSFDTTNAHKFRCTVIVSSVGSTLTVMAMQ